MESLALGQAFSLIEALTEAIVPLLSLTSAKHVDLSEHHIWVSINLDNTICPTLVISWDPAQTNLQAHPSEFQWCFQINCLSWLVLQAFMNSLKGHKPQISSI